jgi:hypothetical protein
MYDKSAQNLQQTILQEAASRFHGTFLEVMKRLSHDVN